MTLTDKALIRKLAREPQLQLVVLHRAARPGVFRRCANFITRTAILMRSPGPSLRWELAKRRVTRERLLASCAKNAKQAKTGHATVVEKVQATANFWL